MNCLNKLTFGLALLTAIILPSTAHAQLQMVEQTVFGMDCAPCAYGLQKGLKSMEGVTKVEVSLNNGLAVIQLAQDNKVTLKEIRESIRSHGFSAEDAAITVTGVLREEDGKWMLTSASGERFLLEHVEATVSEDDLNRQSGQEVTLIGYVPEDDKQPERGWILRVSEFGT